MVAGLLSERRFIRASAEAALDGAGRPGGQAMLRSVPSVPAARPLPEGRPGALNEAPWTFRPEAAPASAATILGGVFETLGLPAASITPCGQIVVANDCFDRLVPEVVFRGPSRLGFRDKRSDRLFEAALNAIRLQGAEAAPRLVPVRADSDGSPMLAHLIPLPCDEPGSSLFLLVMRDLAALALPSPELVQVLFDLTPAESRVAQRIAQGCTVGEVAASTGVASGTIRAQLKAVFAKIGARRQADVARIFARLTI
jgi:DNA-binding CsgD family transcriptional regulator